MATIRDQVNAEMKGFGVAIEDVRIRRADLPEENTQAILSRMQSERQRVAAQARAEGAEASQRIRADAERERTVLLAEARATADKLRGEGEAEATRISAKAYQQDAEFFASGAPCRRIGTRSRSGDSRLVLTPDNEFLRYLQSRLAGRRVPAASASCQPPSRRAISRLSPSRECPTMRLIPLPHPPAPPRCALAVPRSPCRSPPCCADRDRPIARAAPDSFADLAAKLLPAVVNISSTQAVQARAGAPGAGPEIPHVPARLAVRAVLQGLPQSQPPGRPAASKAQPAAAGAAHAEPGLGLHHRCRPAWW